MPIVLRWTPTREDLADAMAAYGPRPLMQPPLRYGAALALLLGGAVLVLLGLLTAALVLALLAVLVAVFGGRRVEHAPGARVYAREAAFSPTEAVLSADGIQVAQTSTVTLPWSAFHRTVESERSFVLVGPRRGVLPLLTYLPKRAAPDVDRLRALLDGVVRPR